MRERDAPDEDGLESRVDPEGVGEQAQVQRDAVVLPQPAGILLT